MMLCIYVSIFYDSTNEKKIVKILIYVLVKQLVPQNEDFIQTKWPFLNCYYETFAHLKSMFVIFDFWWPIYFTYSLKKS